MSMTDSLPGPGLQLADARRAVPPAPRDPSAPPSTLDAPMNARKEEAQVKLHNTMVPRTLTVTGFFLLFAFPAVALQLNNDGHLRYAKRAVELDEQARRIVTIMLAGAAGCLLVGWLWWGVAAALNARQRSRWSVSPTFVPLTYVFTGALFIFGAVAENYFGEYAGWARLGALVVCACVFFATLGAYSKTAQAVGSPSTYFTRLIAIPWVVLAAAGVALFFSRYLSDQARLVLFLLLVLVQGVYGLTMYQAMTAFDRACAGTRLQHQEGDPVANFLKFVR
jgi:hypothetical protein